MNLILRALLASILSLPLAAFFVILGIGIFFLTPFTSTPLFGRLPGTSESFCPDGARLVVERYSRSIHSQAKNDYRVICLDSAGNKIADVSNQTSFVALGLMAWTGYFIAWVSIFRLSKDVIHRRPLREKLYMLVTFSATVALLTWSVSYIYRQTTYQEKEQAAMVVLGATVAFAIVFIAAHQYFHKRNHKGLS